MWSVFLEAVAYCMQHRHLKVCDRETDRAVCVDWTTKVSHVHLLNIIDSYSALSNCCRLH